MMQKNGQEKATIREVYTLIEEMRKELGSSILRLETKFDALEAGRLSTLETKFADFQGEIRGRGAIIAGIIAFGVSIITIVINNFLT